VSTEQQDLEVMSLRNIGEQVPTAEASESKSRNVASMGIEKVIPFEIGKVGPVVRFNCPALTLKSRNVHLMTAIIN
jgi:hypothetical protein